MLVFVAVHPRWRGEHFSTARTISAYSGSSPLARGTRGEHGVVPVCPRFIPAGAGNTTLAGLTAWITSVHPRWRGEHLISASDGLRTYGSSPLARGTRPCSAGKSGCARFIPAGAGNTRHAPACRPGSAVHPRWRGEHWTPERSASVRCGSSPLARGTRTSIRSAPPRLRFIPAGAGNTTRHGKQHLSRPVHPRWRGEHRQSPWRSMRLPGSSPLARGTLNPSSAMSAMFRFIPAGAGNTSRAPASH